MMSAFLSVLQTLRTSAHSRAALQLEILALRHQLQVLQRTRPRRLRLVTTDRCVWVVLSRLWTPRRTALVIVGCSGCYAAHSHSDPIRVVDASRRAARGACPASPVGRPGAGDRRFRPSDRLLWLILRRVWPQWRDALVLVQPAIVDRWHRDRFDQRWWRRSRRPGRPRIDSPRRDLIGRLAEENRLWGAPRIHGELLKLGLVVSERTVSR